MNCAFRLKHNIIVRQIQYRRQEAIYLICNIIMKKATFFAMVLVLLLAFGILNIPRNPAKLISPVLQQEKTLGLNQWFPKDVLGMQSSDFQLTAKSAFFIDS